MPAPTPGVLGCLVCNKESCCSDKAVRTCCRPSGHAEQCPTPLRAARCSRRVPFLPLGPGRGPRGGAGRGGARRMGAWWAGPSNLPARWAAGAMGARRAGLCGVVLLCALGLGRPGAPSCGPGRLLRGTGTDARCCRPCAPGEAGKGRGTGEGVRGRAQGGPLRRGWGVRALTMASVGSSAQEGCPSSS